MPRALPAAVTKLVASASTDAGSDVVPFWESDSEGVPEEGMYLLASELDLPNTPELLAELPDGYRYVFAIFSWEQSRAGEGFSTGIENSGTKLVTAAADAYECMGMAQEASALRRVVAAYERNPMDYEALDEAYEADANPYRDDWVRIPELVRSLCRQADRLFYTSAEA